MLGYIYWKDDGNKVGVTQGDEMKYVTLGIETEQFHRPYLAYKSMINL